METGSHRSVWRTDTMRAKTPGQRRIEMNRRKLLTVAFLAGAGGVLPSRARAQDRYPGRPVRLVIPSVPAGVHDVIGRVWAERVKPRFGTIVIDNRGGGGASIGANEVAHAQPDGYSILLGSTSSHVLVPPTMANPPYDPVKDFSAACVFAYSSTSIVVHPSVPVRTLAELIAYARANPGKLSYGAAGIGSITHLAGEYFKQLAGGLDIFVVPYRGIGQGVSDLLSGQIPMFSANATAQILELNRAGKVRILSVNSAQRIKAAPEIPTSSEAGLPGMIAQTTFAIFAPAGTPHPILERINQVTQQSLADPSFQQDLLKLGFEPMLDIGADKAAQVFADERARWIPILKSTNIKPE
jgi:tripartite-type tricarboxylate transporter receptor subunit TctC